MKAFIQKIVIYPVKACLGIELKHVVVDSEGVALDRKWAIWDARNKKIITQSNLNHVASLSTHIDGETLVLETRGKRSPLVSLQDDQDKINDSIDKGARTIDVVDEGDSIGNWLSEALQVPQLRLLKHNNAAQKRFRWDPHFLVIAQASLDDLNRRLPSPIPMDRFRPTLVLDGVEAYVENSTRILRGPGLTLEATGFCYRCIYTTIDQKTGIKQGKEPLKTLARFKRDEKGVIFGHYFHERAPGHVQVGDVFSFC